LKVGLYVYAVWSRFLGLFLKRRCVITLNNGGRIVWLRPKDTPVSTYRNTVDSWVNVAGKKFKLDDGVRQHMLNSRDVISVEVR
jgi:hypothetical protein